MALGIALVALGVRVAGITVQSLWYDEGITLRLASARSFSGFLLDLAHTGSERLQPLYLFLIYFWTNLLGLSEQSLRSLSVALSICFVAACAWCLIGRAGRGTWLLAGGLAACSSFSVYYSQEARPYALLQLLSVLALGVWLRTRSVRSLRGTAALTVMALLCTLAGAFAILFLGALCLADLISGMLVADWWRRWFTAAAPSAAVAGGWGAFVLHNDRTGGGISSLHQPLWMNLAYSAYGLLFGPTMPPPQSQLRGASKIAPFLSHWPVLVCSGAVVVLIAVAVGKTVWRARRRNTGLIPLLALVVGLSSALLAGFVLVSALNFQPRHASMLLGPLVLLIAACATEDTGGSRDATLLLSAGLAGWIF